MIRSLDHNPRDKRDLNALLMKSGLLSHEARLKKHQMLHNRQNHKEGQIHFISTWLGEDFLNFWELFLLDLNVLHKCESILFEMMGDYLSCIFICDLSLLIQKLIYSKVSSIWLRYFEKIVKTWDDLLL